MSESIPMGSRVIRKGRGGRRPGAGRKPNSAKQLALQPIAVAEIVARRHPQSAALTPEELAILESIAKKLADPSPDASRNQKESNSETFAVYETTNCLGAPRAC